ncbi:DUF559 domain-containing protein [Kineococcus sp. SYSU DK004]|uniref:DUF559 domain-containing protein n=1 Tax=Kineococcus sp. SYSU DK004 TaxID=3383125 RepID=UPI003D7DE168
MAAPPDVLASPGSDELLRFRLLASVLPRGAALARRSAAAVHGFRLGMPHERDGPHLLEVVVPAGSTPLRRAGVTCYAADLGHDVVDVAGLPVTSPLRTAVDVARFCTDPVALSTLDLALRLGAVRREDAHAVLADLPGQRGVRRARRVVDLADPGAESPGESWTRLRLADAGFPRPELQVEVPSGGPVPYRLDCGWRERRVAVEHDGREHHESPADRARDLRRRARLHEEGWTVLAVGAGEVLGRSLLFEAGVGELLGLAPRLLSRRW